MTGEQRRFVPWLTYVLIAANLAVFGVELARGASAGSPDPQIMITLGANYAPLTLGGEWWRLFTSMFLHFGVIHIGMNMLCLYQARAVEEIFGRLGYAAIYLTAGLLGSVASIARGKLVVSAGASGAVFGVYGAFLAFLLVRKARLEPGAWSRMIRSVVTFIGINFAISLQAKGIDVSAHLGGVVAGFLVGAALMAGAAPGPVRAVLAIVVGLGLSGASLAVLKVPSSFAAVGPHAAVLDRFVKVEEQSVDAYNDALRRAKSGELDDPGFGNEVKTKVIPPWAAFEEELAKVTPRGREEAIFSNLRHYMATRKQAWQTFAEAAQTTDADAKNAALERYKKEWDASDAAARTFHEELKRGLAD